MNHSIYNADRLTHVKVVALALLAGIVVVSLSLAADWPSDKGATKTVRVIKAEPAAVTSSNGSNASVLR